jgi:hypothetical protein
MEASDPERSICFDRAADYYDETRSLPAEGRDRVPEILRSALPDGGLCLDVGVGPGRTALPLGAAGVRLVGIDLSLAMMAKAVAKSGGRQPFPLIAGDATRCRSPTTRSMARRSSTFFTPFPAGRTPSRRRCASFGPPASSCSTRETGASTSLMTSRLASRWSSRSRSRPRDGPSSCSTRRSVGTVFGPVVAARGAALRTGAGRAPGSAGARRCVMAVVDGRADVRSGGRPCQDLGGRAVRDVGPSSLLHHVRADA